MDNQPASSPHTIKSVARNIGIGVVTPVLAATIIYFLGFNRSDNSAEFKKRKEATINVWTQLVQNKSILTKVIQQLDSNTQVDVARDNIYHEIDIALDNMENIKKEPNADQRVYSSIDIITQQIKDMRVITTNFADPILAFYAEDHPDSVKIAFSAMKQQEWSDKVIALKTRDTLRLNTFYNGLNKDYNVILPWH